MATDAGGHGDRIWKPADLRRLQRVRVFRGTHRDDPSLDRQPCPGTLWFLVDDPLRNADVSPSRHPAGRLPGGDAPSSSLSEMCRCFICALDVGADGLYGLTLELASNRALPGCCRFLAGRSAHAARTRIYWTSDRVGRCIPAFGRDRCRAKRREI